MESHASLIGAEVVDFAALLSGRLEVAIGLETIHPVAMSHLNKRLELERFDRAAAFLAEHQIDLRVFVLLGVPHVAAAESVEWTARTVEYAAARGAGRIAIIPVRGGNGELERLQQLGHFVPPTLLELENALDLCLALLPVRPSARPPVVTVDLWDVERLPGCNACRGARVARLLRINVTGVAEPAVSCSVCA
ncbi:MAG TPA: hypothetical protein VL549_09990 [Gemmatimonadales bacterium]|nr:hypothetical protein [Gemmatimonadales bacterium]